MYRYIDIYNYCFIAGLFLTRISSYSLSVLLRGKTLGIKPSLPYVVVGAKLPLWFLFILK